MDTIETPTSAHGFVCKRCGTPAPVGLGYAVAGEEAAAASYGSRSCRCGYAVALGG